MRADLVEKFRSVESGIKATLAQETSALKLGLVALVLAQERFATEAVALDELVEGLDRLGVAVDQGSLGRAFSRAGNRIRRISVKGEQFYKVMTAGRLYVADLLEESGPEVTYIEGGKPRTARKKLSELLSGLEGPIRICDPYFGIKSLDTLEMIPKKARIRLLTVKCTDPQAKLLSAVQDFKKEHTQVEIGVSAHAKDIHDRYVLTDKELLLVGHGIKDIGNKESFIVRLDAILAEDLVKTLAAAFDDRWKHVTLL